MTAEVTHKRAFANIYSGPISNQTKPSPIDIQHWDSLNFAQFALVRVLAKQKIYWNDDQPNFSP